MLDPFRRREISRWADAVEETPIRDPPVFIIGTWRTGTTLFHNLMTQDGRFGFVSTLQAFCPDLCIEGSRLLQPIFRRLLPKKRPMDNMAMALEYPQEEEYAMGNLSPYSFYHGYFLPRKMPALFDMLSFDGSDGDIPNAWKALYLRVLKKATLIMAGKRLVLKNPLNTSRIPVLLKMFPEAQFVFFYRNPYVIFPSLRNTFTRLIGAYQLQAVSTTRIEDYAFSFYDKMMHAYWRTKELIPAGHLVEVRFEDFEKSPLTVMKRIYGELHLPAFDAAKCRFDQYLISQADYEKNHYGVSRQTVDRISRNWQFAIEKLGYSLPDELDKNVSS